MVVDICGQTELRGKCGIVVVQGEDDVFRAVYVDNYGKAYRGQQYIPNINDRQLIRDALIAVANEIMYGVI